jgi:hypothetical protein
VARRGHDVLLSRALPADPMRSSLAGRSALDDRARGRDAQTVVLRPCTEASAKGHVVPFEIGLWRIDGPPRPMSHTCAANMNS